MIGALVLLVLLLIVLLIAFIAASTLFGFLRTQVPFVSTRASDIEYICREGVISPNDVLYELGSGNGKIALLVERRTGAKVVGFELIRWAHLLANIKKRICRSQAEFRRQDFFRQSWSEATVVYGYLYPFLMEKIEKKFLSDCKPGARAIVRDFPMPNLAPAHTFYMPGGHEVYVYVKS